MRVIVRPSAAADIEDAHQWYEDQRIGLGAEFLVALRATMDLVLVSSGRSGCSVQQTLTPDGRSPVRGKAPVCRLVEMYTRSDSFPP